MTALVAVNTTPTVCPDCESPLSLPLGSRSRPGMVVQTCKNYQACGRAVWSPAAPAAAADVDDGSRHARHLLPVTSEPEPPPVVAPNRWTSTRTLTRLARRELAVLNHQDRKLAAAGGDR
jgi:hypothetical protein